MYKSKQLGPANDTRGMGVGIACIHLAVDIFEIDHTWMITDHHMCH